MADTTTVPSAFDLRGMAARFAPAEIGADISSLALGERRVLAHLLAAARIMDAIFLRQVWAGNDALLQQLARSSTADGGARLRYFLLNKGPWSRLDHNQPFVPGVPAKPEGANFYPPDSTKVEIQTWLDSLTGEARERATGFFTTIRRSAAGLVAVPYSLEYQGELSLAAGLLREAATLTSEPSLSAFLSSRADAFLSNDYYASDVAWMELESQLEPTIGPYEVYEDEWFNYKAAFEAFITIRDDDETDRLQKFARYLQDLEDALPIDPAYRNPRLGSTTPIRVVNVLFAAGDANRGVQTAAFNLPNDERVVKEKGTKSVMLKNVQEAKFRLVLLPIADVALAAEIRQDVSFEAFFTHILLHELMHGLGPHNIDVAGRATTVRRELKEIYSVVEEAKADCSGLWAVDALARQGVVAESVARALYPTFLASAFRSIRFGINEAHGRGVAVQVNFFLDASALMVQPNGRFTVDAPRMRDAVTALTREIMTFEAEGNYEGAAAFVNRLGVVRPEVQNVLNRLTEVPVDVEPGFLPGSARF